LDLASALQYLVLLSEKMVRFGGLEEKRKQSECHIRMQFGLLVGGFRVWLA
jgi:hypothetical protein